MLLVIGDANADVAARTPRFPGEGDDVPLADLAWSSGGAGVNVATAFARLGGSVRLLARVGCDPAASVALAAATASGVDTDGVERDPARATGLCFVLVSSNAERTFLSYRGANAFLSTPPPALWAGVRHLHVCGHALLTGPQRATALALIAEAARRELPVSLDLCLPLLAQEALQDGSQDGSMLGPLWPVFDIVFANEVELQRLVFGKPGEGEAPPTATPTPSGGSTGGLDEAARWAAERGARTLVVKRGARGSTVVAGPPLDIAPFVVDARDTTAAGDGFVAGFLWALAAGAEVPLCARIGNAVGALKATRPGSAGALPSRSELIAFLEAHGAAAELALVSGSTPDSHSDR